MANTYFQFKEFIIHQDKAAMKVGTDGVLLGAWADVNNKTNALDIGTGTGLIAIMMAQRSALLNITALDIDASAVEQAIGNADLSPWKERLQILQSDFVDFASSHPSKFDLVVSNPPFFSDSLKNACDKKSTARHNDSLSFSDLLAGVSKIMTDDGCFCVVLPSDQFDIFTTLASVNKLFLNEVVFLKPTPAKMAKRVLIKYSFLELNAKESELIVEEFGRHQYSNEYKLLTKDFYLKF